MLTGKVVEKLESLVRIWLDIAYLLNERDLDPTYYSVFRDNLHEWIKRSENGTLHGFVAHVRSELDGLSKSVALSTGISMTLIWEAARPIVPVTLEQWNGRGQLITLLDEFDSRVAFQTGSIS